MPPKADPKQKQQEPPPPQQEQEHEDEKTEEQEDTKEEKKDKSTSDSIKKTCEKCSKKFRELYYCVHCAISCCGACRQGHCGDLIDEYEHSKQKAYGIRKKVQRKIGEVGENLEEVNRSSNYAENTLLKVFEELEEDLKTRKKELMGELRRKKYEQSQPLISSKKDLEKELGAITRRFESSCTASVSSLRAETGSSGNKVDDSKFARLCACNYKSKESLELFHDLSEQSDKVNQPKMVRFSYKNELEATRDTIKNFGKVEIYGKNSGDEKEEKKSVKEENEEQTEEQKQ